MNSDIKYMAELLKTGAKMLSESCPKCSSPLFKVKNEIFCAKCKKAVVKLKSTGEESKLVCSSVLESVEQTILKKIQEIESLIKLEKELDKLEILKNTLSNWLDTLEKINKIK